MLGLGGDRAPEKGTSLRLVTWNLRNFPGEHQDLELLKSRLGALDADIIAVQEIKDPAALRSLLPEWELAISKRGGRGHQKLGVLYNPGRVELVGEPAEHDQLSLRGRVRPAFSAYLRGRGGGPDFHLVVVHLKAMTKGYSQRAQQWPMLAELVASLQETDPGAGDSDVILVDVRWPAGAVEATSIGSDLGIPIVVDCDLTDEPVPQAILTGATHVVFSQPAFERLARTTNATTVERVASDIGGFVGVTMGSDGVVWSEGGSTHRTPAFVVEAIDTLGAGDVFHGTFALGVAEGHPTSDIVRWSSAAAAVKCAAGGGRDGFPSRHDVVAHFEESTP